MSLQLDPQRPAIAVPVSAPDTAGVAAGAAEARAAGAELIEWRLDALTPGNLWAAPGALGAVRAACDLPILATYRSALEGGPGEIDDDEYEALLAELVEAGVDAVDVELTRGEEVIARPVRLAHSAGVTVVGSSHDFSGTPDDLPVRFAELARRGSDVLKVAVTPHTAEDVLRLLTAALRARGAHRRAVVPVAMGALGLLSRVGGALWGAPFTFARVGGGSAPGQLTAAETAQALQILQEGAE